MVAAIVSALEDLDQTAFGPQESSQESSGLVMVSRKQQLGIQGSGEPPTLVCQSNSG